MVASIVRILVPSRFNKPRKQNTVPQAYKQAKINPIVLFKINQPKPTEIITLLLLSKVP
jgi:hypothetical protein